jgi:hypothetical protein
MSEIPRTSVTMTADDSEGREVSVDGATDEVCARLISAALLARNGRDGRVIGRIVGYRGIDEGLSAVAIEVQRGFVVTAYSHLVS